MFLLGADIFHKGKAGITRVTAENKGEVVTWRNDEPVVKTVLQLRTRNPDEDLFSEDALGRMEFKTKPTAPIEPAKHAYARVVMMANKE